MANDDRSNKAEELKRNLAWLKFLNSREPSRIVSARLIYAFIIPGMIFGYILGSAGGPVVCCFSGVAGLLVGGYLYTQYRMRKLKIYFRSHVEGL